MQDTPRSFEYDIRPAASILSVFSRLSYKPHYAIAEFVDNSTQSFFLHKKQLVASEPNYQMRVIIDYDSELHVLTIHDNASGMTRDRFLDAITLDAKNLEQENSRNEFGMGLKTAASWFGNVWTVSSTALGSSVRYTATVDIPALKATGMNNIEIVVTPAPKEEHGTTITINQVTKGLGSRAIGKIRSQLSSMYRRDIESGEIAILVNKQELDSVNYPILEFREKRWKKPIDFTIEFQGKQYRTTGFVGIMDPGSFPKAGFALFRRNRTVIGGEDQNYKPHEIFGQAQTQVSLKLFGELNMDDYPVNQAKDGFIWDDGLEEAFIQALMVNISDYIKIARLTKLERKSEESCSQEASARIESKVRADLNKRLTAPSRTHEEIDLRQSEETNDEEVTQFERELREYNLSQPDTPVGSIRTYQVPISPISNRTLEVSWTIASGQKWIDVCNSDKNLSIVININHPFFKPFSNDEDFQCILEKLVVAFVTAEEQAKTQSDEKGYIPASSIRRIMNNILSELGD